MLISQITKILPIIYAIIGFGLLILVHEFGHFIFCKAFGVHTPTFSIGMGPKIVQKKIGTTNFQIAAFPLGGYLEIAGLQEIGQGEQKLAQVKDETSFSQKPYWQKFLILIGGVSFNLIFAYIALILLFLIGAPKPEILIGSVEKNSLAERAGLLSKDKILKVGESDISEKPELLINEIQKVHNLEIQEVKFVVQRGQSTEEIIIPLPQQESLTAEPPSEEPKIKLGIQFDSQFSSTREKLPFFSAIKKGVSLTNHYIFQTLFVLKNMIKQRSVKGAGGPVLIIKLSVDMARRGIIFLLIFLAIISISLAIMNLLPLPVLDGGQLLFLTIEAIIGREIPLSIKNSIHLVSIFLLIMLFLYITYNDILFLIKK